MIERSSPLRRTYGLARFVWWAHLFALLGLPTARADLYEVQRFQRILTRDGHVLAASPEGKRIAWIRVEREEVFAADERLPRWWNLFHGVTLERVIRRELLFAQNETFDPRTIEETMRNLRGMDIFALVRIAAVETAQPNEVGVIVYTRDMWSLHLDGLYNISSQINLLSVRMFENNLAGKNVRVGFDFTLVPKTYTVRQFSYARRVLLSSISVTQDAGLIFRRRDGRLEGGLGSLNIGVPFYRIAQRHAVELETRLSSQIVRRTSNGQTLRYPSESADLSAFEAFRERREAAALSYYFRAGDAYKSTLGVGWDYRRVQAQPTEETSLPVELEAGFARDVMPYPRRELGPALSYELWTTHFATFTNLTTFAQSENVRLGPAVLLRARAPLSNFGSDTNSWVVASKLGWVLAPASGLLDLSASAGTRREGGRFVDVSMSVLARAATRVIANTFRLVARLSLEARRRDTTRAFMTLGSDSGLRGYPSQAFHGYDANRLLGNLELRSLPLRWGSLHVGMVLFYDVGSLFGQVQELRLYHAGGAGLRVVLPQIGRNPTSFDLGVSRDPELGVVPSFSDRQLVPLTSAEDSL